MVEVHLNARSPVLIVWSLIMLVIGMIAVALRIASMRTRRRGMKLHDYLVFTSMVSLSLVEFNGLADHSKANASWIRDRYGSG